MMTLKEYLTKTISAFGTNYIKNTIGDSVNNNRTLTIRQMIRFLTRKNASKKQRSYGRGTAFVYTWNLDEIRHTRRWNTNRTDAYDINELMETLE